VIAILVAGLRLRNDAPVRRWIEKYGVTFTAGDSRYSALARVGHKDCACLTRFVSGL
jgi:hypothetical protein